MNWIFLSLNRCWFSQCGTLDRLLPVIALSSQAFCGLPHCEAQAAPRRHGAGATVDRRLPRQ
ncbi:MAG: hypothetical protein AB7K86_24910 [Rhodospirillales bacterium]